MYCFKDNIINIYIRYSHCRPIHFFISAGKELDLDAKSRASLSPEKSVGAVLSGMTDDRMTPDSGVYTPLGSKKKSQSVTSTSSGRQSTAIQRLQMDKAAKEIRAKQVRINTFAH